MTAQPYPFTKCDLPFEDRARWVAAQAAILRAAGRKRPRCPYAEDRCRVEEPVLKEIAPEHLVACHLRG